MGLIFFAPLRLRARIFFFVPARPGSDSEGGALVAGQLKAVCRFVLLLGAIALEGCATYSDSFGVIERNLSAQQYDAALQDIEKQSKSKNGLGVYLLDQGMG